MEGVYIKVKDLSLHIQNKYFQNKDIVSLDEIIGLLEDIDDELEDVEDKYNDLQQDLEDNYIPRPMSDYTGSSYDDRF